MGVQEQFDFKHDVIEQVGMPKSRKISLIRYLCAIYIYTYAYPSLFSPPVSVSHRWIPNKPCTSKYT